MKNFFKTNWITLSASLLSAVVIWIYVVYQINPIFETTIRNVPISYVKYSDKFTTGKLVTSSERVNTANIKIKGKRSVLSKINKDAINCTVDMSGVFSSGTHKIPISVTFNASGVELVSKDPYSVNISVDDVITNELTVEVNTKGKLAPGFIQDSLEYNIDKVRISGPETLVKKEKKARVIVDVSGKSESTSGRYKIILEDKEGNILNEEGITKNISYIEVKCNILYLKEVYVVADTSGDKTASGKTVTAKVSPETVKLVGNRSAVSGVEYIRTETIDSLYVKDGDKINCSITGVPENVRVEGNIDEVEVTFEVK